MASNPAPAIPYDEGPCVFSFQGVNFAANGAVVTGDYIVAYPGAGGVLNDWHGRAIGTWKATHTIRSRRFSYPHMLQIEASVAGVTYTGRGQGVGMIYKGRRKGMPRRVGAETNLKRWRG